MTVKLCKDCKWVADPGTHAKCNAPSNDLYLEEQKYTGFTGTPAHRWTFCTTNRSWNWIGARVHGACGKEGRWWEPK